MNESEMVAYLVKVMASGGTITFAPDDGGKTKVTVATPSIAVSFGTRYVRENLDAAVLAHRAAYESIAESSKGKAKLPAPVSPAFDSPGINEILGRDRS